MRIEGSSDCIDGGVGACALGGGGAGRGCGYALKGGDGDGGPSEEPSARMEVRAFVLGGGIRAGIPGGRLGVGGTYGAPILGPLASRKWSRVG